MKLAVLEPLGVPQEQFQQIATDILGDQVEIIFYPDRVEDTNTLIQRSKDADIVMLSNFPYKKDVLEHCPNLKMICVAFTGVDHIDMEYCKEHNILVSNCSGYATVAVAELVFGLLISLYRNMLPCDAATRQSKTKDGLVGFELAGKKFGVIGAGEIGQSVITIANAFGCDVYVNNGNRPKEVKGATSADLPTLLQTCDIVSLHTPLTPETKGLIGKKELEQMKSSAVLINTARGPVVDNEALAEALNTGVIAGAAIDVFDMEPPVPSDYPLLHAPNTLLTPHVAFATKESMVKRAYIAFENVKQFIKGTPQNIR